MAKEKEKKYIVKLLTFFVMRGLHAIFLGVFYFLNRLTYATDKGDGILRLHKTIVENLIFLNYNFLNRCSNWSSDIPNTKNSKIFTERSRIWKNLFGNVWPNNGFASKNTSCGTRISKTTQGHGNRPPGNKFPGKFPLLKYI